MKIFIDDGSTNVKIQWRDGKTIKTHISPNSFVNRWQPAGIGSGFVPNYLIAGARYSFDMTASEAMATTEIAFQYSHLCAVAIHHALHTSGLTPGQIEIAVTLPVAEYFDRDGNRNQVNIDRKKALLMQPVLLEDETAPVFEITDVTVRPESIPAAYEIWGRLSEFQSVLMVDLGGTTLDIAKVNGGAFAVSQVKGFPTVGVSSITRAVQAYFSSLGMSCSATVANKAIESRDNPELLTQIIRRAEYVDGLVKTIEHARQQLAEAVVGNIAGFTDMTHIMLVGGGAPLIAPEVHKAFDATMTEIYMPEKSQTALVEAIRLLEE